MVGLAMHPCNMGVSKTPHQGGMPHHKGGTGLSVRWGEIESKLRYRNCTGAKS